MAARKWLFAGVVILCSLSVALAAPPAVHPVTKEPLVITCYRGTPDAIDGNLGDWNLDAMTPAVLDASGQVYTGQASWTGPADCSGKFYLMWDDQKIYIGVEVKDDQLSMTKTGADIWNADAVEVFFSTTDTVATHTATVHYQYGFNANSQKWNWCNMDNAGAREPAYLQVASTRIAGGYLCEVAIEYGQMKSLKFTAGNTIGFHPVIDDTEATDREIQMTWTSREAHDQTLGFGHVLLSAESAIAKELARRPNPANKATDVPTDTVLAWEPGQGATSHDVYFGAVFADVNTAARTSTKGVLASQGQAGTSFDPPGRLAYGQTYYWRVDEVAGNTISKGQVWSFTAEPYGYPIQPVAVKASTAQPSMGPEKTIDGSGLNKMDQHGTEGTTMWLSAGAQPNWIQYEFDKVYKLADLKVWNYNALIESFMGFGAKQVKIETSTDETTWKALANAPEFARGTGLPDYAANTTVNFGGVEAKFVKLTIEKNWGVAPPTGLSEVRFSAAPMQAFAPQPATAATNVDVDATLSWRPGREAGSHKVFFGTDQAAVAAGTAPAKTVTERSYNPGGLNLGTTYYWKVDEVNAAVTYPGSVWSFSTQDYKVVEDFESYTDKAGNEVWSFWIDGFADNYKSSGSTVGLNQALRGTFCETTIIHGGAQSMPLAYDNTKTPISEAVFTFATPQNWSLNGIKSLSLWFQGVAGNGGQLYVKINNTKVPYDGVAIDLAKTLWMPWNIDLSKAGNVSKVTSLTIGIEGTGAKGLLYIDDIRLYPKAPAYITPVDPGKTNLAGLWTLDGTANDTSGKGNNGTVTAGTAQWVPGQVGQALQFNGGPMYVDCGTGASLKLTDAVTITAWIKMDFTAGDRKIAANQDGVAGGYKLGLFTNNKVEFEVRTGGAATLNRNATGGVALQQGVWYHVAGVYSKGQFIRTYVFGNLDREMLTTGLLGPTAGSFKIGRGESATTYFWLGALDEVQVYNKALSPEEILWLAGQTKPVAKPF